METSTRLPQRSQRCRGGPRRKKGRFRRGSRWPNKRHISVIAAEPTVRSSGGVNDVDLGVRRHVYRRFVELGRAPLAGEVAQDLALAEPEVEASFRRLHDAHALVLEADGVTIRMANPFSAVETHHRVEAGARSWHANCAWDAFGIPAALGVDGHISSRCPCCDEAIEIDVRDRVPVPEGNVVHLLVPAKRWWDDIVFT
jgi:hypothetical protein